MTARLVGEDKILITALGQRGDMMQITIELLSFALGFILGIFVIGLTTIILYFDDEWDTAFGYGWKRGMKYQQEKEKQDALN
jgi:hypothetical protein